ncbi:MAG: MqnA/MqnD/SBP family protein, partial [Gaiellaceae bacterium]
ARADFAYAHPGLVKDVHNAFVRSRELSLARVDEVAASAARWEDFDAETLVRYFTTLDFSLGDRQLAGLTEFARRVAARIGLAPLAQPRFVEG